LQRHKILTSEQTQQTQRHFRNRFLSPDTDLDSDVVNIDLPVRVAAAVFVFVFVAIVE
jgi:hypothetical protein